MNTKLATIRGVITKENNPVPDVSNMAQLKESAQFLMNAAMSKGRSSIMFNCLSNETVQNADIVYEPRSNNNLNNDTSVGCKMDQKCSTCNSVYHSGCKGHLARISIDNVGGVLSKPATMFELIPINKFLCGKCGVVKNPVLMGVLQAEKNPELRKAIKKNMQTSKCYKCEEIWRIVPAPNKTTFVCSSPSGTEHIKFTDLYSWYRQLSPAFLKTVIGLPENFNTADLFFINNFPLIGGYYREGNSYGQGPTNDSLNIMVQRIISAINEGDETKAQIAIQTMDDPKNTDQYKNNNNGPMPLIKQVNGTDKNGILKGHITGKRKDQTARMVLGPLVFGFIGEISLPRVVLQKLDTLIYYNTFTKTIVEDITTVNTLGIRHKQTVIMRDSNAIIPYQVINHDAGSVSGKLIIAPGDYIVIDRQEDDMPVLHNRQPTLHEGSTLAATFRVKDENIIRTPPTVMPPQNADCDGDEQNVLNVLNPVSQVEASFIPHPRAMVNSHVNSTCIFGLTVNFPVALRLLYEKKEMTMRQVAQIIVHPKYISMFVRKFAPHVTTKEAAFKYLKDKTFSGAEVLSIGFDNYITKPGYFEKGILAIPESKFTNKTVSAFSQNSVFTVFSKYSRGRNTCDIVDYYSHLAPHIIQNHGLSIIYEDVIPMKDFMDPIQKLKIKLIHTMNRDMCQYLKDGENKKIYVSGEKDLHMKRIEIMTKATATLTKFIEHHFKTHSKNESVLLAMYKVQYKVSTAALKKIYGWLGYIPIDPEATQIACRNYPYFLPNDQSVTAHGFIASCLLEGLGFDEIAHRAKCEALPQSVTTTCGTGTAGALGKRMVKSLEPYIVSTTKSITLNNKVIWPVANFIGVSGGALTYLPLKWPHKESPWYPMMVKLYKKLVPGMFQNYREDLVEFFMSPIDIEMEVESFNARYYQKKYKLTPISDVDALRDIVDFIEDLIQNRFFDLCDINFLTYLLVMYLDPRIQKKPLSVELMAYLFDLIEERLAKTLAPKTPIGLKYATSIQETITQTAISSFHTESKGGRKINTSFIDRVKTTIELGGRSVTQLVSIYSPFVDVLEYIKDNLNYVNIGQLNPIVDIKSHVDHTEIEIILNAESMLQQITISAMYDLIKTGAHRMRDIRSTLFQLNVEHRTNANNMDEIVYTIYLNSPEDKRVLNKELSNFTSFLVKKGLPKNSNIQIEEIPVYSGANFVLAGHDPVDTWKIDSHIPEDGNPPPKDSKLYCISFLLNEMSSLEPLDLINCKVSCNLYDIQPIYGNDILQDQLLLKLIEFTGDFNMYPSYYLLTSSMCKNNKPQSLKGLKKGNHVIRASAHGDGKVIAASCVRGTVDPCGDSYSSMFAGEEIPHGTNTNNISYDLSLLARYANQTRTNLLHREEDVIVAAEDLEEDIFF